MKEEWKTVPRYEGLYEASSLGRVRSLNRLVQVQGGERYKPFTRKIKGKILSQRVNWKGYHGVTLCNMGRQRQFQVHRLVLHAFVGRCPKNMQVNHKNGNKSDNTLDNLKYVTQSENMLHSHRVLGRNHARGENHYNAKLKESDVIKIKQLHKQGLGYRRLGKKFGVARTAIRAILQGRSWAHLS